MRRKCLGTGFEQTPETLGNIKSKIAALDKDALGGVWVFRTVCFERVVLSSPGCLWPDRMDDRSINQRNGTSVITAGTAVMSVIARGNLASLAHATTGLLASRHLPVRVSQSIDR